MASLQQRLNMGPGTAGQNPALVPTAQPGSGSGGAPPLLAQGVAGMQPGGPRFAPDQDPMAMLAEQMDHPEIVRLFGDPNDMMPPLSLMDVLRLFQMQDGWNGGSPPYGAIL